MRVLHSDLRNRENRKQSLYCVASEAPRLKSAQSFDKQSTTPNKQRVFGDELDTNNFVEPSLNSSFISMDSKETAISALSVEDTIFMSSSEEASSVAQLRGWLNDFGEKNKKHYAKLSTRSSSEELVKGPTRPKVLPSKDASRPTPLPVHAATVLARRIEKDRRLSRSTPVRIKPKILTEEVQATNEGYASVAKLSAWLADDPTKTRKTKQIRRGANVIAKSRKFDKGLADVIIEEMHIRSGGVSEKKDWLMTTFSNESDDTSGNISVGATSVSAKKEWLGSAFKKDRHTVHVPKAKTDIMTSNDERDEVSSRAKAMWRNRTYSSEQTEPQSCQPKRSVAFTEPLQPSVKSPSSPQSSDVDLDCRSQDASATECDENRTMEEESREQPEGHEPSFRSARNSLVERSKKNGTTVEVMSAVKLRKAKFERLGQDARRKSLPMGMLKPSWSEDDGGPSNTYIKKYLPNVPNKKTLHQLP